MGEIETNIVGMQYYDASFAPGERVNLEREPENRHDSHAIRVKNGLFDQVGHLPRQVAAWLSPAIDEGTAVVEEVSEDGDVPNLAVTNRCDRPILITEGEILVGAKQNRVVNITMLVAARVRSVLPVSCVEQGRWEHRGRPVQAEYAVPPSLRSKKLKAVQRSRSQGDQPRGDQAEVWADVDACLTGMGVESETSSLTDGYVAAEKALREGRERLPLGEVGSDGRSARRHPEVFCNPQTPMEFAPGFSRGRFPPGPQLVKVIASLCCPNRPNEGEFSRSGDSSANRNTTDKQ